MLNIIKKLFQPYTLEDESKKNASVPISIREIVETDPTIKRMSSVSLQWHEIIAMYPEYIYEYLQLFERPSCIWNYWDEFFLGSTPGYSNDKHQANAMHWLYVLSYQPNFIRFIGDISDLIYKLRDRNGFVGCISFVNLLKKQPQIIDATNIKSYDIIKDIFFEFDDTCWSSLLLSQPQFANLCDEFNGWRNPRYHSYGGVDRYSRGEPWSSIDIAKLVSKHPQFIDKFDWNCIDIDGKVEILSNQPQFVDRFDINGEWRELKSEHWARLLTKNPSFEKKFEEYYGWSQFEHWGKLLSVQLQYLKKCDEYNGWEHMDWSLLLAKRPQFADKCDKWNFWHKNWVALLLKQPQFADKCDKFFIWKKFDAQDWVKILSKQPQFSNRCFSWGAFHGSDIADLIEYQPQFLDKFNPGQINEEKDRIATIIIKSKLKDLYTNKIDFDWDSLYKKYRERLKEIETERNKK